MSLTRDENVFMARLAEKAERYEDMVQMMRTVAQMGSELNPDERNLLAMAYKHSVGSRRQAWRAVGTLEEREGVKGPVYQQLLDTYRTKVEDELNFRCNEILDVLKHELIPRASSPESRVFYHKMKGDYFRYLAEFCKGQNHSRVASEAHDAYQMASDIATNELTPTDPVRLNLALNFSVFYYEVFSAPEKACLLAKAAFNDALTEMDELRSDEYEDVTTIMQLLRDNLTLWTGDMKQE